LAYYPQQVLHLRLDTAFNIRSTCKQEQAHLAARRWQSNRPLHQIPMQTVWSLMPWRSRRYSFPTPVSPCYTGSKPLRTFAMDGKS